MAPFYGWGSTASRIEPLRGGSLLFTTKFPEKLRIVIREVNIALLIQIFEVSFYLSMNNDESNIEKYTIVVEQLTKLN